MSFRIGDIGPWEIGEVVLRIARADRLPVDQAGPGLPVGEALEEHVVRPRIAVDHGATGGPRSQSAVDQATEAVDDLERRGRDPVAEPVV